MAFQITENLRQALKNNEITPILVAKIEGRDKLLTNVAIQKYIRIGDPDLFIDGSWLIGGFRVFGEQSPYITFNTGTTTKISQKLDPSRGQGSSVSSMVLSLVDKNEAMTQLVSPGFELDEILAANVTIYSGLLNSSWPEDYNIIFRGVVQGIDNGSGYVNLLLSNTEEKKRTSMLTQIRSEITEFVNYHSAIFQSLFFRNRSDVPNFVTVTYTGGGTAGSEVVSVVGYTISVQIQSGVSTAGQIRKAIENHADAMQILDEIKVGDDFSSSDPQVTGSVLLEVTDEIFTVAQADLTSRFYEKQDCLRTYIKIQDELIEYAATAGSFTDCLRGQQGSIGTIHEPGQDAVQVLRLTENAMTLALKLLISGGPTYYKEDVPVKSIVYYDPLTDIPTGVIFANIDLESEYGVCVGDYMRVYDSANFINNLWVTVLEIGLINGDTYILTDMPNFVPEAISDAKVRFQSQFNVLNIGVGLLPQDVDVKQHLFIRDTYLPNAPIDIFVDQISNGKDFIEQQIYLPYSCFSVPRKGRSSVAYHIGPLPTYEVLQLNVNTVKNPEDLRVQRSTSENFFNQVVFSYDKDVITGDYRTVTPYSSDVSMQRMPSLGARPFQIPADGFRTADGAAGFAERTAARFLKRYQFGAEFIKNVRVMYEIGYRVEIGDIVAVDFSSLKLGDSVSGSRSGPIKLYEVLNKILDNKTGDVSIDVVNTIFGTNDRFGLISPTTRLDVGSTTTKLLMKKSFGTREFEKESVKWRNIIGREILVHNEDWTTQYTTTLLGFDNNVSQGMLVEELPTAPAENWYVDIPRYPNSEDKDLLAFFKNRYAFFSPQVFVTGNLGFQNQFEVDPSDIDKFFVGAIVKIHTYDYTSNSADTTVIDVDTGTNVVTIEDAAGFIIDDTTSVELIGFKDQQPAYRIT